MLTLIHTYFLGTNLNSSIICFLSSGDIYLFLDVAISTSSSFVSSFGNFLLGFFFETLVILSAILLPMKSPVASAVFWVTLFDTVFIASVVDFLALSRSFDRIYYRNFYPCFQQRTKIHILLHIFDLLVQLNIPFLYVQSSFNHHC